MLDAVASHFEDCTSLIAATHVCHLWRTTLLSYPCHWSHLDFANEERALVYLERSKSAPLNVNIMTLDDPSEIVSESLKKVTTRVAALRAVDDSFLDELLAQPMPMLDHLEILTSDELPQKKPTHLPSLTSLAISGLGPLRFHAPILTTFHLTRPTLGGWSVSVLLNFLRSCPLLEVAFFSCNVHPDSEEVVSLPVLRLFTHESRDKYRLCLLDRLSIPPTCRVHNGYGRWRETQGISRTDRRSRPLGPPMASGRKTSRLLRWIRHGSVPTVDP